MKLNVYSLAKQNTKSMDLPSQFSEEIRPDIVKRAVEAIQANKRQPYGAHPEAGLRASAQVSKRRRKYRGCYGSGMSRTPRKILSRNGTRMNWVGAVAPNTVGGRRAHPPKAEKIWEKKINKKEKRKAIRSAMAATMVKELVESRGHKVPEIYPFILENKAEDLKKTKDVVKAFTDLGLTQELDRTSNRKVRSGKGKVRGRKYRTPTGPLLVVSKDCDLLNSAVNITGVEVVKVENLNAELLAPGTDIGRLTLFTEAAIERLQKEKLFSNDYKGATQEKKKAPKKGKKKAEKTKAKPAAKPKTEVKPKVEAKSKPVEKTEPKPKPIKSDRPAGKPKQVQQTLEA